MEIIDNVLRDIMSDFNLLKIRDLASVYGVKQGVVIALVDLGKVRLCSDLSGLFAYLSIVNNCVTTALLRHVILTSWCSYGV